MFRLPLAFLSSLLAAGFPNAPARPAEAVAPDSALAVSATSPANSASRDEIFLAVFKHPAPKIPVEGYVAVTVDGSSPQKVKATIFPDRPAVLLEGSALIALLSPLVRADVVDAVRGRFDAHGAIASDALPSVGIAAVFQPRRFELHLEIPPELRERTIRFLDAALADPSTVDAIRPAAVSAFLNFNLKAATGTESVGDTKLRRSRLGLVLDGAVNVRGWVLEGAAFAQGGRDGGWQRGDFRVVHDRARQALRFVAGDLSYPALGYQTNISLGGVGLARDFSLQPHIRTYRTGQFEFYLDRPAEVELWVNDSLLNTLRLPAGPHDLRGLSPAVGHNDMRLVIEDAGGRRETMEFSFIFNPTVLERGRNQFSLQAGLRRFSRDGQYRYDADEPVVMGSYLEGVTDDLTLGGYLQADRSSAVAGAKALQLLPLGTLQLDVAAVRSTIKKWDVAAKLEFTHAPATRARHRLQTHVYAEFLGRHFAPIGVVTRAPDNGVNFGVGVAMPVGSRTTAQLSGSFTAARRSQTVDAYNATATLTRRWGNHTTGSVAVRHRHSNRDERVTELLVGLSVSFVRGTHTFYAAKELYTDAVAARWDSGRTRNVATPYGFAQSRVGEEGYDHEFGLGYWTGQGMAELAHSRTRLDLVPRNLAREETALRLQGALVFAGGRLGLSRAVMENFAIVAGTEGLANVGMRADPDGLGGSRAHSSWLSPVVIPDLSSYRVRELRVEPINPPLGATPDKLNFVLAPTYKSGSLVRIGRERRTIAIGRVVDEDGAPLRHETLEIRPVERAGSQPVTVLSGRAGVFQLLDARPGRYEIRAVNVADRATAHLEIHGFQDDVARLGDVVLKKFAAQKED